MARKREQRDMLQAAAARFMAVISGAGLFWGIYWFVSTLNQIARCGK